eukprot:g4128.t1
MHGRAANNEERGQAEGGKLRRNLSRGSRYAIDQSFSIERKVSNVLDTKDAARKRREQLEIAQRFVRAAKANNCSRWYDEMLTAWTYRATEMWGSGTQQQIKVLLYVFLLFWIMCSLILFLARLTDRHLGYEMDDPFCGNNTICYEQSVFNFGLNQESYLLAVWDSWTYLADPGTHAGEETWARRAAALLITFMGILFMATIIGFVSNTLLELIDEFRTGKSAVVEEDHTVLLGWTSSSVSLISEIIIANESEEGTIKGVIVVLANGGQKEKEEIESVIAHTISSTLGAERHRICCGRLFCFRNIQCFGFCEACCEKSASSLTQLIFKGTKIVVRAGNYTLMHDLENISIDKAKAIVVQAPAGNADKADATTLRAVLSLKALELKMMKETETKFRGNIIAELRDIDNQLLIQTVGGKDVLTVVSHDIIGRIMIKSARNPGLADVYEGLLGFEGAEFYMKCHDEECPDVVGMQFGDLFQCFENAIPFGVHRVHVEKNEDHFAAQNKVFNHLVQGGDNQKGSSEIVSTKPDCDYFLNPPSTLVIIPGDEIIVLAEDDDTYSLNVERCRECKRMQDNGKKNLVDPAYIEPDDGKKEKILMMGWRRDIDDIIRLLNDLTGAGSELHIMSELGIHERTESLISGGLDVTDKEVAYKDDSHGSGERWGAHSHDNYVLKLDGKPNLRLVHHEGNPANSTAMRKLNFDLVEFWGSEDQENLQKQMSDASLHDPSEGVKVETERRSMGGQVSSASALRLQAQGAQASSSSIGSQGQSFRTVRRNSSRGMTSEIFDGQEPESLGEFDSVLIMADAKRESDPMHSDSNVLAALLLLKQQRRKQHEQAIRRQLSQANSGILNQATRQELQERSANNVLSRTTTEHGLPDAFGRRHRIKDCTITFEIVDPRTQQILKTNEAITTGSYYIISTHIVAKYLAMVSERKEIHGVLRELLGPMGAEITLMPIEKFVRRPDKHLTFREIQVKCRHLECICLGYVQHIYDKKKGTMSVVRSGTFNEGKASGLHKSDIESSEPLPQDMDYRMVWSGEDEEIRVSTKLIVIKGRHHDMETLEHFGLAEQAMNHPYLTVDFSQRAGVGDHKLSPSQSTAPSASSSIVGTQSMHSISELEEGKADDGMGLKRFKSKGVL